MFLPIRDDNPHTVTPYVNYAVIGLCVLVFLWQFSLGDQAGQMAVYQFGLIPGALFGNVTIDGVSRPSDVLTVFTSMFMHGGWMHLLGNMLYLWIFGDNIEASLGHKRYLVFYLVCGVAAAIAQVLVAPNSDIPMIGASGAVSGILGAYMMISPRANVKVFVLLIIFITVINLPAFVVLGVWFLGQLLSQSMADPNAPGVAFMAHIGGFIAGAVLVFFFRQRGVPVFQPSHSRPFAVQRVRRGGSVPQHDSRKSRGPWD